jgi:hypothetical protein
LTRSTTGARHSCDSPEWFTPAPYVEAARKVLGGIDLDPASHREANRIVRARRFYSEKQNGLRRPWSGRVFLNPPGGHVGAFWYRLMVAWFHQEIRAAIWIGYSLEQLQTLQGYEPMDDALAPPRIYNPLDFPICVPDRRIAFVESEAKRIERFAKIDTENRRRRREGLALLPKRDAAAPSHANYIVYLGMAPARFAKVFRAFGEVRRSSIGERRSTPPRS